MTYRPNVITPMPTPLTKNGCVDKESMENLVNYLRDGGVDGYFVLGTLGQGPAFTDKKKENIIAYVRDVISDFPLYAGVMDTSTERVLKNIRNAADFGADFAVVTPPFYFSHTQEELANFFREVAESSEIPIVPYNIPGNTYYSIEPETVEKLNNAENIAAIKDTSKDMNHFKKTVEAKGNMDIYQGWDSLFLESMKAGGYGVVSGMSNMIPETVVGLVNLCKDGDFEAAKKYQEKITPLLRVYGDGRAIPGISTALELMGIFNTDNVTSPFGRSTADERKNIEQILKELNVLHDYAL